MSDRPTCELPLANLGLEARDVEPQPCGRAATWYASVPIAKGASISIRVANTWVMSWCQGIGF